MLQMIKTILFLFTFFLISNAQKPEKGSIEWLLEDAFEDEHIALSEASYVLPSELLHAQQLYRDKQFRSCIEILEKVRRLQLPDNQLDFIAFLLGEAYLQLQLKENAKQQYQFITENFPHSDEIPPSLFRIMELSVEKENVDVADSIFQIFRKNYLKHPLYNSIIYSYGKLLYKMNRFEEAAVLLSQVSKNSSRFLQSQFVASLCYIQLKEHQKALMLLDYVKNNTKNSEISAEAIILIGDIYYSQNNFKVALEYYKTVPKDAYRYQYSVVKSSRSELDIGNFANSRDIARAFIKKYKGSEYYFEMASILEQAYTRLNDEHEASKVEELIQQQIVNGRLAFEVYQEIDHLVDLGKDWQMLENKAIRSKNMQLLQQAQNARKKIKELNVKNNLLLGEVDPGNSQKSSSSISHLTERRYLSLLKKQMSTVDDSITMLKSLSIGKAPNGREPGAAAFDDKLSKLQKDYQDIDDEYSLIVKECLGGENERKREDEDMQTKFVDWAFMKYIDKKEVLKKTAEEIAAQKKSSIKADSSQAGKALVGALAQINYEKIGKTIVEERDRLIDHIEMMQQIYKRNAYNPQILFRLAELYFDKAGTDFQEKLHVYEKKMEENKDSTGLVFPEYDLSKVITIYNEIITRYPKSEMADKACFFKALALQKEGDEDKANDVLLELVDKYPESEYFVEANMNIGRYFFEHPKINKNQGYKLAEDAYRKVLFYRDHPQYVQALYHLGWCYYMQDRFDEAIAVFKYLIEEAKLDFDASKMEEKQVANPLLRGEAIDYIAISFDEEGKVDEVMKFLKTIGNNDYSALVLKRIAELRQEDLDFSAAVKMYRRLLTEYPLSTSAPEASMGLIKLYESKEKTDSAMIERENFLNSYCSGSKWSVETAKKDTSLLKHIDSIAVSNGLYVADANYRDADKGVLSGGFEKAAQSYQNVVEKYPVQPSAADARWNLAVIMETKLFDKPQAYQQYFQFSRLPDVDSSRREQAALNAIAIAQSLLPADTLAVKGELDFSAEKVVESVKNYLTLFAGGSSYNKVLLGLGAIYFNRHLFAKAEEIYGQIVMKGPTEKEYFEALLFMGQCYFGEEKWSPAIVAFEKVWKESDNETQKSVAYKFLLQSEFLSAKGNYAVGNYEQAAEAFKLIDEKYPGSEYGDVVLFNAADAFEKKEFWLKACDSYYDLVKRYPNSKLAPDALFNAASDFEKGDKFPKAAEVYEQLVAQYAQSEKAKDALFNLGLCYEKMGKLDEMAQVNERYSALYPGEKDVEAMLLRSGAYYAKTGVFDKAINVYRNFIRRFPNSPKIIESMYMIAKCSYDQGDKENALLNFNQTEMVNQRFTQEGGETNSYFASEAAYYTGMIKREKFLAIKLLQPDVALKKSLKDKSDLLAEAVKSFQRVVQYQSERMFEAAYRIGELYEQISDAYQNQERPSLDPIKAAVLEKDIFTLSSQLLQKSFAPYSKVIEMGKGFDSLNSDQKSWIEKSKDSYTANALKAGQLLFNAITAMNSAPVPKEIQDEPLHNFQYLKQLLETLTPLKLQVAEYYSNVQDLLTTSQLLETDNGKECQNQYAYVNFLIGEGYDHLSAEILKSTQEISKNMTGSTKEDLLFQFEDIVYELQDKAIMEFVDASKRIEKKNLTAFPYYKKIIECLARLSPDKYGAAFYKTEIVQTDLDWIVRSDSVGNWNNASPPVAGWKQVKILPETKLTFSSGKPDAVWCSDSTNHHYFWRNVYLNGLPRNLSVSISTSGKYNFYLNGVLTLKDTVGHRDAHKIDSASGISSLAKGGDNVIAVEAIADSGQSGFLGIVLNALIDTAQHFDSTINVPFVEKVVNTAQPMKTDSSRVTAKSANAANVSDSTAYIKQYKNHGEFLNAITAFKTKEEAANKKIETEKAAIRKLMADKITVETNIQKVRNEISALMEKLDSMSKEK